MLRSRSFLVGSGLLAALSAVACSSDSLTTPGTTTLEITTSTSGTELDADGYTVQVDAGAAQAIGASASVQRTDLSPGDHTVQLAGMAANCSLAGDNPRTVSVAAGQTTTVSFAVTCGATTGGLQVTSSTTGPSPDADGFTVTVDGVERGTLGASGAVNVDGLAPGDHVVGVSGVAANCQVQGDNPRTVTVTPGSPASIAFTVTCAAPPAGAGMLRVTVATTGADLDPDGYALSVDGGKSQPIGVNGTAALANIAGGSHSVKLAGVASNCTIQGANPRSASVSAGATAEVSFAISCDATSGTVKVNVTTTGSPTDPDGYVAKLDSKDPGQPLSVSGSTTFVGVPAGAHTVELTGVASTCNVTDAASRSITVSVGANVDVSFAVTCSATTAAKILFVSSRDGPNGIFTMNRDGTQPRNLTPQGGSEYRASWSPDGSRIAFTSNQGADPSVAHLFIMNGDGSGQAILSRVGWYTQPAWSPDGQQIAYLAQGSNPQLLAQIFIINQDGSGPRQLTDGSNVSVQSRPSWSPDGSRVIFAASSASGAFRAIFVIRADGSSQAALTNPAADEVDENPQWSPDGSKIAFVREQFSNDNTSVSNLWVMGADGSSPTKLTNYQLNGPSGSIDGYSWAPDGNRLVFSAELELYAIKPDGNSRTNLTNNGFTSIEASPAWSPDGTRILFTSWVGGAPDLFAMNPDGSNVANLTNNPASDSEGVWQP